MQHSPSRVTNPESLRVNRDFELREHFSEDVCSHIVCRAILDFDVLVGNGLLNEMISYVDVFGPRMIVVVGCEVKGGLIVAVESCRRRSWTKYQLGKSS
jgi:hypothetical protein